MKTAKAFLKNLQDQKVQLMIVDGDLDICAPKGVVTPEMCALLAQHKAAFMELLSSVTLNSKEAASAELLMDATPFCGQSPSMQSDASLAEPDPLHKPDILAKHANLQDIDLLDELENMQKPDMFAGPSDVCLQCGAEVQYYSDQGEACCELHRFQASQEQCQASSALARVTQAAFFGQDVAAIGELLKEISGPIALDLETTGLDPQQDRVVSISFGIPDRVFVLDMRPYYALTPDQQAQWRQALELLFEELADVTWIGHNIKFDWSFLAVHFGVHLRQVYDTMLVEQVLHAGRETPGGFFSLRETAGRYQLKVSKQQRNWFVGLHTHPLLWTAPFPHEQLVYMVQDIEVPYHIADQQRSHLVRHGLKTVAQLENLAVPAIASMEVHGVLIDQKKWKRILENKRTQKAEIEQELVDTLGAALQAARQRNSQVQIREYETYQRALIAEGNRLMQAYTSDEVRSKSSWQAFYDSGIAAWKAEHPEPSKPRLPASAIRLSSPWQVREALAHLGIRVSSTEEEVLEAYTRQYPIIQRLLTWRKLNHFCQAFGDNVLAHIKADGRIHANFSQTSAVSGRIICRTPNLQQIPKQPAQAREAEDVRRCFIAPEGSCILTADLSNIELRILAEVSGDATMLHLFTLGKDMHAETARAMFGLSADIDTRHHFRNGVAVRDIAKTINFGLVYGMGVQGLANRIGVSIEEARELMHTYFATYRGVANWLRQSTRQAIESGYATTLAGRKRFFMLAQADRAQRASAERSAKNHPIQGANADILKRALALLYAALPERVHLLLCVHDEIVLECPEGLLEEAERILKEAMVQACRDFLKIVAIPEPEVVVGDCWIKK